MAVRDLLKRKKSCNETFQDHFMGYFKFLTKVPKAIVLKVILCFWNSYISDNLVDAPYKLKNLFLCVSTSLIYRAAMFISV